MSSLWYCWPKSTFGSLQFAPGHPPNAFLQGFVMRGSVCGRGNTLGFFLLEGGVGGGGGLARNGAGREQKCSKTEENLHNYNN